MDEIMKHLTYDDVRFMFRDRILSEKQVAEWFPLWCEGKGSFRFRDGKAETFYYIRTHPESGEWVQIDWVNGCIYKSKMGQN